MKLDYAVLTCIGVMISSCNISPPHVPAMQNNRVFESSFESIDNFNGFYIVPQNQYDSNHELASERVVEGNFAHKAWITSARDENNDGVIYLPHRAYPTIQLYKMPEGKFVTPCFISFWAYLDMNLEDKSAGIDDWFSFATLSPDDSDNWVRTILVNITPDGYLRLVHVPNQGEQEYIYQAQNDNDENGELLYPYRQWVKIDIYIDFSSTSGYAKVWQNGILISHARVSGCNDALAQAHFGLYASAAVNSGEIYNDKLKIMEIENEEAALEYVN